MQERVLQVTRNRGGYAKGKPDPDLTTTWELVEDDKGNVTERCAEQRLGTPTHWPVDPDLQNGGAFSGDFLGFKLAQETKGKARRYAGRQTENGSPGTCEDFEDFSDPERATAKSLRTLFALRKRALAVT